MSHLTDWKKPGIKPATPGLQGRLITNTMAAYANYMSGDIRFPTMWYVRPAKLQVSLRIRAV